MAKGLQQSIPAKVIREKSPSKSNRFNVSVLTYRTGIIALSRNQNQANFVISVLHGKPLSRQVQCSNWQRMVNGHPAAKRFAVTTADKIVAVGGRYASRQLFQKNGKSSPAISGKKAATSLSQASLPLH